VHATQGAAWCVQADRQAKVDDFNNEDSSTFVFLISTKAGGLGLNLTAANKCAQPIAQPRLASASGSASRTGCLQGRGDQKPRRPRADALQCTYHLKNVETGQRS